jgi:transposase InsO family protein
LLALLGLLGPGVGLPTLLALCPEMARREIQDMLRRYRRLYKRRCRALVRVLHWHRTGAVWATDFAEPPLAVDGCYSRLLAVRDLASGFQLAWLPVADESAQTAHDVLIALFRAHGAPLVLKSDNGSAFIADHVRRLLNDWQVWHLRSPPDLPEYNGACEAGIGSMKTRTHHQGAHSGRPGAWTCDDAEAARLQANETARPWGCRGPTPAEVWAQRRPLTNAERSGFGLILKEMVEDEYAVRGIKAKSKMSRSEQAAVDRAAIARALVAARILSFTSQLVAPPLNG